MSRCRCHSGKTEKRCCGPLHAGKAAPTAEALMRSRYAAYAKGMVDYVLDTTAPGPMQQDDRAAWADQVRQFSAGTRFLGLRIAEHVDGEEEAFVTFFCTLEQGGRDASFGERSRFVKVGGRWAYHSGQPA
ncbi:MAG: zinc chelation protein SecC [Deltaproteobacteria bacterium]|nr:MAG: zinc chelation protein SecC [Deltaproteobacteria bacterium]